MPRWYRKARLVGDVPIERDRLKAYLPSNYWPTRFGSVDGVFGYDEAGWTLDEYVIPRCATGLIWLEEITNHPEQFRNKLYRLEDMLEEWRQLFKQARNFKFPPNSSLQYDLLLREILDHLDDTISLTSAIQRDVATLIEVDKDALDEG